MKYQNIKAFKKHLSSAASCKLAPLYLIILPDPYERKKIMEEICRKLPAWDPIACTKLDAAQVEIEDIIEGFSAPSLFEKEIMVMVDNVDSLSKSESERLSGFLGQRKEEGLAILGAKGKTALLDIVEKRGVILDVSGEKPWDKEKRLTEEILERALKEKKKISMEAIRALLERSALDFALLDHELEKLFTFAYDKALIDLNEVRAICVESPQGSIWSLAEDMVWKDALFKDFLKGALVDEAFFHTLVSALRYQLEIGYTMACTNEIPSQVAHLPPKILESRKEVVRLKGFAFFKEALIALFEIDLMSKDGVNTLDALLEIFRLKCVQKQRQIC